MKRLVPMLLTALAAVSVAGIVGGNIVRSFSFRSSEIDYKMSTKTVSGEFCDPNSPLSSSGYFDRHTTSLLHANESTQGGNGVIPFVIWLQGGPGCSSLLGMLEENGPCLINDDGNSTRVNPYSWTEVAHVLYLDQPSMAGYSYGNRNDINDDMIEEDTHFFLQSFFKREEGSKYRDLPLVLTGESFAGHYIPAIARRIWKCNKKRDRDLLHLPLSGLAIRNGWYDGEVQITSYAEMALNNPQWIKLVNETEYEEMKIIAAGCTRRDMHKCKAKVSQVEREFVCQKAVECRHRLLDTLYRQNISEYDITKPCVQDADPDCDPMGKSLSTFLNNPSTKAILGVPTHVTWKECGDYVSDQWSNIDLNANYTPYISELLNNGIPNTIQYKILAGTFISTE
ncbi:hypothetical protein ACHAWF_001072 [Thalassiosira exigua]